METTCLKFTNLRLDEVADYMFPGGFFVSADIKSAYRSVHVCPLDRQFQCFVWEHEGQPRFYQDNCLCFGLRCAPFIFTQLTEFVVRCMSSRGVDGVFGYLDDFLVIGLDEADFNHKLTVLIRLLRPLGFWISWKKVSPTGQKITYLGIELDSVMMEFRLPQCELYRLVSMVTEFSGRETVSKKDLQKLAGHLAHASTVVRGGRTFFNQALSRRCLGSDTSILGNFLFALVAQSSMCYFFG